MTPAFFTGRAFAFKEGWRELAGSLTASATPKADVTTRQVA
jgi:hypothetical protein